MILDDMLSFKERKNFEYDNDKNVKCNFLSKTLFCNNIKLCKKKQFQIHLYFSRKIVLNFKKINSYIIYNTNTQYIIIYL